MSNFRNQVTQLADLLASNNIGISKKAEESVATVTDPVKAQGAAGKEQQEAVNEATGGQTASAPGAENDATFPKTPENQVPNEQKAQVAAVNMAVSDVDDGNAGNSKTAAARHAALVNRLRALGTPAQNFAGQATPLAKSAAMINKIASADIGTKRAVISYLAKKAAVMAPAYPSATQCLEKFAAAAESQDAQQIGEFAEAFGALQMNPNFQDCLQKRAALHRAERIVGLCKYAEEMGAPISEEEANALLEQAKAIVQDPEMQEQLTAELGGAAMADLAEAEEDAATLEEAAAEEGQDPAAVAALMEEIVEASAATGIPENQIVEEILAEVAPEVLAGAEGAIPVEGDGAPVEGVAIPVEDVVAPMQGQAVEEGQEKTAALRNAAAYLMAN